MALVRCAAPAEQVGGAFQTLRCVESLPAVEWDDEPSVLRAAV
jgi:hypothetical protein